MTLCLIWKRGHSISFAADSRLTGNYTVVSDIATKVFAIPVKITSEKHGGYVYDLQYGMCFCGSFLNASLLADSIAELLSSLTTSTEEKISAETIADIAFKIYQDVSDHLIGKNQRAGLCEVVFGGFCQKEGRFRVFKFSWEIGFGGEGIDYNCTEMNFENPIYCIGDSRAVGKANELAGQIEFKNGGYIKGYTEYHVLNEIIEDAAFNTVGGAIQTGHFLNQNFSTFGMQDYELGKVPGTELLMVIPVSTYRGIPLMESLKNTGDIKIRSSKISMAPFPEKERALEKQAYDHNNPSA